MSPTSTALRAVRRRWWVVTFVTSLCAAAAIAVAYLETPLYAATAQMLVDTRLSSTSDFDSNLQNGQLLSQYFIAKAKSRSVLEGVATAQGLPPSAAEGLGNQISVQVLKGSQLLAVTATSRSPGAAADLANAVADQTVIQGQRDADQRFAADRTYLDSELRRLDGDIAAEQLALRKLQSSAAFTGNLDVEITTRQTRINGLQEQYSNTYSRRQALAIQQDRLAGALSVSERAVAPDRPVRPVPPLYLAAGLLGGLVLGVLLALLLGHLDRRVRGAEGLAEATGAPVTVSVDYRRMRRRPGGVAAAYSLAWATLLSQKPKVHTVMLVGASGRDNASRAAADIADIAAHGNRAVLVLGDDDSARHRQDPGSQPGPNTTALTRAIEQRRTEDGGELSERHDIVIASVPAPSQHPAAMVLARSVDAAIVVATDGRTDRAEARHTAESLRAAGVSIAAGILVVHGNGRHERRPSSQPGLVKVALNAVRGVGRRRSTSTHGGRAAD
jgi:capsular polysaccharide biosynthesis protein